VVTDITKVPIYSQLSMLPPAGQRVSNSMDILIRDQRVEQVCVQVEGLAQDIVVEVQAA
jgi:hypothetical protein